MGLPDPGAQLSKKQSVRTLEACKCLQMQIDASEAARSKRQALGTGLPRGTGLLRLQLTCCRFTVPTQAATVSETPPPDASNRGPPWHNVNACSHWHDACKGADACKLRSCPHPVTGPVHAHLGEEPLKFLLKQAIEE